MTWFLPFIMSPSALLIWSLLRLLESAPLEIHPAISLISYLPPSFVGSRISLTCAVMFGTSFFALTVLFPQIYSDEATTSLASIPVRKLDQRTSMQVPSAFSRC
jgi:hypothetical protein